MKIKPIFLALTAIFIVACSTTPSAESTTKTAAESEMEEGNYEN